MFELEPSAKSACVALTTIVLASFQNWLTRKDPMTLIKSSWKRSPRFGVAEAKSPSKRMLGSSEAESR